MSSSCRCHTEDYCFYCEDYLPLKSKFEVLIKSLNKIDSYLRDQVLYELDEHNHSTAQAFQIAADKVREVLENASSNTGNATDRE